MSHKQQEISILEHMVEDGSYSSSAYADRVQQLGKVFTTGQRKQLEQASEPPAPRKAGE